MNASGWVKKEWIDQPTADTRHPQERRLLRAAVPAL